jgi:ubiquinone/menaquinone biosynthesis C-methylase UbiE
MNPYTHWLLPRLIDLAMRNPQATRLRQTMVPAARGRVLELGAGSGLNLPYYDGAGVTELYALDPSTELLAMARSRQAAAGFPVTFLPCPAEAIPLASGSIDTVVSTWTLCSVADAVRALGEARRVLAPGGTLIFVEHGLAPDAGVGRWQQRLNPLWRRIAGGCNLNRSVDRLVRAAGFEITDLHAEYLPGPRPFTYTSAGRARRA